jgi:predicted ATPase
MVDVATAGAGLPAALSSFIGRQDDVATVTSLLDEARLVTLTGPAGCGKTRLAIAAATVAPIPATFVELAGIGRDDSVSLAIREAMGLPEFPNRPAHDVISSAIGDRPLLLVLDNCEHVVDDAAATVASLLRASPGLRVLATSREPLRISGEQCWVVPSLALPRVGTADDFDSIAACDAVRLFVVRARQVRRDFCLAPSNVAAVVELVTRLDGMPLAIELAAAHLNRLAVADRTGAADSRHGGHP